jgi:hypothetical protein
MDQKIDKMAGKKDENIDEGETGADVDAVSEDSDCGIGADVDAVSEDSDCGIGADVDAVSEDADCDIGADMDFFSIRLARVCDRVTRRGRCGAGDRLDARFLRCIFLILAFEAWSFLPLLLSVMVKSVQREEGTVHVSARKATFFIPLQASCCLLLVP